MREAFHKRDDQIQLNVRDGHKTSNYQEPSQGVERADLKAVPEFKIVAVDELGINDVYKAGTQQMSFWVNSVPKRPNAEPVIERASYSDVNRIPVVTKLNFWIATHDTTIRRNLAYSQAPFVRPN